MTSTVTVKAHCAPEKQVRVEVHNGDPLSLPNVHEIGDGGEFEVIVHGDISVNVQEKLIAVDEEIE